MGKRNCWVGKVKCLVKLDAIIYGYMRESAFLFVQNEEICNSTLARGFFVGLIVGEKVTTVTKCVFSKETAERLVKKTKPKQKKIYGLER